jgi:ubiquinone/menaquinone biosynthesis C-methylase UbiE
MTTPGQQRTDGMSTSAFDAYAATYDGWFLNNLQVLHSEVALLAHVLQNPGRALSVGCGSGLFELLLRQDYGIVINEGIEPSERMAAIASKRGLNVRLGTAEATDFGHAAFDTVLFNGTTSYMPDLGLVFGKAYRALKPGGRIVVADVPKESSYAMLYTLAHLVQTWDHALFAGITPPDVYPVALVTEATWRTTPEKAERLTAVGFTDLAFAQTLTRHPVYSNLEKEAPIAGYDRGDYVAIRGVKPSS